MQRRTEYRRWEQGQLKEEVILLEEDNEKIVISKDEDGEYSLTECGFRGDYGEAEPIFDEEEEDDEGEGKPKGS